MKDNYCIPDTIRVLKATKLLV